jgi:hypothetical protein
VSLAGDEAGGEGEVLGVLGGPERELMLAEVLGGGAFLLGLDDQEGLEGVTGGHRRHLALGEHAKRQLDGDGAAEVLVELRLRHSAERRSVLARRARRSITAGVEIAQAHGRAPDSASVQATSCRDDTRRRARGGGTSIATRPGSPRYNAAPPAASGPRR